MDKLQDKRWTIRHTDLLEATRFATLISKEILWLLGGHYSYFTFYC